jgi:putative membrane protein
MLLALLLALGACGRGRGASGRDAALAARAPGDTAQLSPIGGFVETGAGFTDAGILAMLDEASQSDSVAAALAFDKATDSAVKAFAAAAMQDHHALRVEGDRLVRALGIVPRLPASDPVGTTAEDEMIALRATPRGPNFDRIYIEKAIATDQAVKDLIEQARRATPSDEIRHFIDRVMPMIQRHLERARALRSRLPKTA